MADERLCTRRVFVVTDRDTAAALGSGDVPVLGTPALLAWLEAASVAAVAGHLPPGRTSVGVHVELDHLRASPVGATVVVEACWSPPLATTVSVEVRAAQHESGADQPVPVASGLVRRAVVDRGRFLGRLPVPGGPPPGDVG